MKKDFKKITHAGKRVLRKYFSGVKLIYPDAKRIYADKVTSHNISKIFPAIAMNPTLLTCAHVKRTGSEIKSVYFALKDAPLNELKIIQVTKRHGAPRAIREIKITDPTFAQAFDEIVQTNWDEHITIYSAHRDNTNTRDTTYSNSKNIHHSSDLDR